MLKPLLLAAAVAAVAPAAHAQAWTLSGNIAVVSDYRFRGYSLSDEQPALQGGLDVSHADGWYAGVWASTIDEYGLDEDGEGASVELDFALGRAFTAFGYDWDVGIAAYTYPNGRDVSYLEIPISASRTIGDFTGTAGLAYAPAQENLGDEDNLYLFVGANLAPESWPVAVDATIGWEDGVFGDRKLDWTLSLARSFGPVTLALRYVDADAEDVDATVLGEITVGF
jgi:uncharacterized protein (TIGR02001 family)